MYSIEIIFTLIIAYLFGSFSSAILVCKIMGLPDPRTQGSCNPGATNVLRIGGKKAAAFTLCGDVLKGIVPVLIAKALGFDELLLSAAAGAAFVGHLFPLFFGFQGGKGVATALGAFLALSWPAALCWMGTWLGVAFLFRYSSLAALIASILTPFYMWIFTGSPPLVITVVVMDVILIYRHRSNIKKLLAGKESKIGKKV